MKPEADILLPEIRNQLHNEPPSKPTDTYRVLAIACAVVAFVALTAFNLTGRGQFEAVVAAIFGGAALVRSGRG